VIIQTRAQAKKLGERYYFTGKACPQGHISERETNSSHCMECRRVNAKAKCAYSKAWRESNPERVKLHYAGYVAANKQRMDEYQASYRGKNAERLAEKERRYRREMKEQISARDVARKRLKRLNDPAYACIHRLRSRAAFAYAGKVKPATTIELIGCSPEQFKAHMESLFKPGMSWDLRTEWHIDHIIPLSAFDLDDPVQAKAAFNWKNCQPLWAVENLRKGASVGGSFFRRDAAAVRGEAA
jgi:5-methylcytosine-specific restriction endonuclease McrA